MSSNTIPNTKYFQSLNANIDNMEKTLNQEIKAKKFDFIVVIYKQNSKVEPNMNILNNYHLIKRSKEIYDSYNKFELSNFKSFEKKRKRQKAKPIFEENVILRKLTYVTYYLYEKNS